MSLTPIESLSSHAGTPSGNDIYLSGADALILDKEVSEGEREIPIASFVRSECGL